MPAGPSLQEEQARPLDLERKKRLANSLAKQLPELNSHNTIARTIIRRDLLSSLLSLFDESMESLGAAIGQDLLEKFMSWELLEAPEFDSETTDFDFVNFNDIYKVIQVIAKFNRPAVVNDSAVVAIALGFAIRTEQVNEDKKIETERQAALATVLEQINSARGTLITERAYNFLLDIHERYFSRLRKHDLDVLIKHRELYLIEDFNGIMNYNSKLQNLRLELFNKNQKTPGVPRIAAPAGVNPKTIPESEIRYLAAFNLDDWQEYYQEALRHYEFTCKNQALHSILLVMGNQAPNLQQVKKSDDLILAENILTDFDLLEAA
jgi:hypothetical protein